VVIALTTPPVKVSNASVAICFAREEEGGARGDCVGKVSFMMREKEV
jgi:hypothetical protein